MNLTNEDQLFMGVRMALDALVPYYESGLYEVKDYNEPYREYVYEIESKMYDNFFESLPELYYDAYCEAVLNVYFLTVTEFENIDFREDAHKLISGVFEELVRLYNIVENI